MAFIDPANSELYALVLKDAPYVIAAYAILWLGMVGYITVALRQLFKTNKEVALLEEAIAAKTGAASKE